MRLKALWKNFTVAAAGFMGIYLAVAASFAADQPASAEAAAGAGASSAATAESMNLAPYKSIFILFTIQGFLGRKR
jgi:hypothetical protein